MSNEEGGTQGKVSGSAGVWREAASLRNGNGERTMAGGFHGLVVREFSKANYLCPGLESH